MPNHQVIVEVEGKKVTTLEDILPEKPGIKILFIAKTPVPKSVEAGHYFQGRQGKMFWNLLAKHKILTVPPGSFEDDYLLKNGFGITDIVKVSRYYQDEPSELEYRQGTDRIIELIKFHKPKVVVFVYKKVLDQILVFAFQKNEKSKYGFNLAYESLFGCKVFVFPMPGTPCTKKEIVMAMNELSTFMN